LEKSGAAQEGRIRAVEIRKYKMKNEKSICRKLVNVWNCENYVENGKGEERGKDKKTNKGQKTKNRITVFIYIIYFPSYSENHLITNGSS
jgi:hypothetical protein